MANQHSSTTRLGRHTQLTHSAMNAYPQTVCMDYQRAKKKQPAEADHLSPAKFDTEI